ncbi:protein FAR1-RELATED SEQUENCE 5-like [Beta vulgaris subsp. vulgaris]|uniref:protein FAR1-RELATED SEQUENCE 5-like n=1 Tax=Beta vulgaris subsp. vulgaris TaxID=3555 RepID=UPI0025491096|nr:protein FAR1-RELATED SEQUENCE 5-like [Beta vulgaris subsp. vulgaris]
MEDISENDVDNVVLDNAMEDLGNEGGSEEDELEKKNEYVECETSELIHKEVANDEEAYKLYNEYAFKCGFGIRKGKVCWRYDTKTIRQRFLVCSREGLKDTKGGVPKAFTKLDQRCGYKAFIQFDVSKESGFFIVTKHHMIHNHPMVPLKQRHLIRSHRKVTVEQLHMINNLRSCGVRVAEAVRVLRKEAGGSANLGFVNRDAYDAVATQRKKELDGCDSNQLIKNFTQRQAAEYDFYYDVRLDAIGHLISFFWRDGRMRKDYEVFGDLVVHDTTYRTNKYGMICGPFVGMNHHQRNVMFGVGFLLNEDTDSFVWLFDSFLKSMGGRSPITIMTDQDAAMAKAISIVFPNVIHRLCIWHIGKNSINNIKGLRGKAGFVDLFNYVLEHCETKSEFKQYWTRGMVSVIIVTCSLCGYAEKMYILYTDNEYIDIPEESIVAHSTQNKSLFDVYGPDDYCPINHIPGEGSKDEQPHHKAALEVYHEYSEKLFGN